MTRQMVMMEVDVPPGYEATGEWRPAQEGECFLDDVSSDPEVAGRNHDYSSIILRPKWQPPACFPDGAGIGRWTQTGRGWWVTHNGVTLDADDLAQIYGETFTPPEGVTTIQVQRGTP